MSSAPTRLRHRHPDVDEGQLGGVRAVPAELVQLRPTVNPGVPLSITSRCSEPLPGKSPQTAVVTKSARTPLVMYVFDPFTT